MTPIRKPPVSHKVRSHAKRNGTRVWDYNRGSGTRAQKPSRVVGGSTVDMKKMHKESVSVEAAGHAEDYVKLFKDLGFSVRSLTLEESKEFYSLYPDIYSPENVEMMYRQQMDDVYNGIGFGHERILFY